MSKSALIILRFDFNKIYQLIININIYHRHFVRILET